MAKMNEDGLDQNAAIKPRTEIDEMLVELEAREQAQNAQTLQGHSAASSIGDDAESDERTCAELERYMNLDLADLADDDRFLV